MRTASRTLLMMAAATAVLALAGCAGAQARSYSGVDILRSAYERAGATCENWVQDDGVGIADESGSCNEGSTVLMHFASSDDRDELLDQMQEAMDDAGGGTGVDVLVGPNWVINGGDTRDLQAKLGGTIRTLK